MFERSYFRDVFNVTVFGNHLGRNLFLFKLQVFAPAIVKLRLRFVETSSISGIRCFSITLPIVKMSNIMENYGRLHSYTWFL